MNKAYLSFHGSISMRFESLEPLQLILSGSWLLLKSVGKWRFSNRLKSHFFAIDISGQSLLCGYCININFPMSHHVTNNKFVTLWLHLKGMQKYHRAARAFKALLSRHIKTDMTSMRGVRATILSRGSYFLVDTPQGCHCCIILLCEHSNLTK